MNDGPSSTNILIVDDHPLMAEGIKANLEDHIGFQVKAIRHNGKEALTYLSKNEIDLMLMDIEMPEMNGIDCAKQVRQLYPNIKIIILSMFQEESLIENFINLGIKGYLLKTTPKDTLREAIQTVIAGGTFFSEELMRSVNSELTSDVSTVPSFKTSPEAAKLTTREIEIITLLSRGYTNGQIADALFISVRTVETHRANVLRKTKSSNIASLVRFGFKNGIL